MKKKIIATIVISTLFVISFGAQIWVVADGGSGDLRNTNVSNETREQFGLETINIPYFPQISLDTGQYSIFSWLGLVGALYTVVIVIFWIFYIIRAAFKALKSEGTPEELAESTKQIKSVFVAVAMSVLFPVLMSIIGLFLGAGNVFQWPKAFQKCPTSSEYDYFFQAAINIDDPDAVCY